MMNSIIPHNSLGPCQVVSNVSCFSIIFIAAQFGEKAYTHFNTRPPFWDNNLMVK